MKALTIVLFVIVAAAAWRVASIISPDAIGMAVGMLFGVLSGIPISLLIMASNRRGNRDPEDYEDEPPAPLAPAPVTRVSVVPATVRSVMLPERFDPFDVLLDHGGKLERLSDGTVMYTSPAGRQTRMIADNNKDGAW